MVDVTPVIAYARAQIGKPYKLGAAGPAAFDCSGLTTAAYRQIGVTLTHLAAAQMITGTAVNPGAIQAGDLLFPYDAPKGHGTHVQLYTGGGRIIEAGDPVTERASWSKNFTARRIVANPTASSATTPNPTPSSTGSTGSTGGSDNFTVSVGPWDVDTHISRSALTGTLVKAGVVTAATGLVVAGLVLTFKPQLEHAAHQVADVAGTAAPLMMGI